MPETTDLATSGEPRSGVLSLLKNGSAAGARRLWQAARQHPMPVAVIGLGFGWMAIEASRGNGSTDAGSSNGEAAKGAGTGLLNLLEEDPLKVGAAALALGFVAGLVLPSTSKEDEWMGETRERLLQDAREAGQEALQKGRRMVVESVADGLKEAAAEEAPRPRKQNPKKKRAAKRVVLEDEGAPQTEAE
jgi:hypothetical protein